MLRLCDRCFTEYDDERCSTLCAHYPLMSDEDMSRKIAAIDLMDRARGKLVKLRHMGATEGHRLLAVTWNGMVEVEGFGGEFAPHLFEVVDCGSPAAVKSAVTNKTASFAWHNSGMICGQCHFVMDGSVSKNDIPVEYRVTCVNPRCENYGKIFRLGLGGSIPLTEVVKG